MNIYVPWALTGDDEQWINGWNKVNTVEEADIVVFTGGADISPEIYGCEKHYSTWASPGRDKLELSVWDKIKPNQLVIGICRGAQLVCALNGGLLIQDVKNHNRGGHQIINAEGDKEFYVTSLHHQMMYPFNMDKNHYSILYSAKRNLSPGHYEGDKVSTPPCEPEIVLFNVPNKPKCLAIQGHPEMMRREEPLIAELNKIIKQIL